MGPDRTSDPSPSLAIFYVYEHWRPDTSTCFYVGKGKNKRAFGINRRREGSIAHVKIVNELRLLGLRPEVRFVAEQLTEVDAFRIEIDRIKFWRDHGVQLANRTDGGDGPSGRKLSPQAIERLKSRVFTEDHRRRISEAKRGKAKTKEHREKIAATLRGRKLSPEHRAKTIANNKKHIGVPRTEEDKRKISKTLKGIPNLSARGQIPWCKGKQLSVETRAKMSAAHKGRKRGPMPLVQKQKIRQTLLGRSNVALKGKRLSEGHRQKLVDAWVRRKAAKRLTDERSVSGTSQQIPNTEGCHPQARLG